MTFSSGAVLTAAQLNTHLRDNLNETAPAKASVAGQIFAATGANAIAARLPSTATVATSQTTASTSYTDMATVGPAVTVNTGPMALVGVTSTSANNTSTSTYMGYDVSGATTIAATDARASVHDPGTVNKRLRFTAVTLQTGLTPGSNTFTSKYKVDGGTATYFARDIFVIPF